MSYWKRFVEWCQEQNKIKIRTFNPGIGRAELLRGAKAGTVSGVIYGAINAPIINIGINLINGNLRNYIARVMTDGWFWLGGAILMNIFFGVILGLIFGLIFVALYDKLPGKTPTIKGIVTSIIYWVTIPLGLSLLFHLNQSGFEGLHEFFSGPHNWMPTAIGLGALIIWGWLLGRFWESERFGEL